MLTSENAAALQDRLDALEARAMRLTGTDHASAYVRLSSRSTVQTRSHLYGEPDNHPYRCHVHLGPIKSARGNTYPGDIEATGPDPLAAIQSAFSVLHQRERVMEPAAMGDEFDPPRRPDMIGGAS